MIFSNMWDLIMTFLHIKSLRLDDRGNLYLESIDNSESSTTTNVVYNTKYTKLEMHQELRVVVTDYGLQCKITNSRDA